MAYNPLTTLRQNFGNALDFWGTSLGLGEGKLSEKVAGGSTMNTFNTPANTVGRPQTTQVPTLYGSSNNVLGAQNNTLSGVQSTPQYNQPSAPTLAPDYGQWQNEQSGIAQNQAQAELEAAMNEYNRQEQLGQQQIGQLEGEQRGTLSDIEMMRGRTQNEATTAKTDAEQATQKEKGKALSTAQDVTKQNRNILRALGILSSSAAGEMLTKPMNQFAQTAADLGANLVKRKQQVDQWLMERGQDFDSQVRQVQQQYTGLINNIRTDLRYNGEQRATAVKAASAALQQRLGDIRTQAMQYQQAAREYNNNILGQIAQLQIYQNPNADISGILSSMLNPGQQRQPGQTASIYQSEEQRRKAQGNTLSGLG